MNEIFCSKLKKAVAKLEEVVEQLQKENRILTSDVAKIDKNTMQLQRKLDEL